jgi:hypothetical protein
MGSCPRASGIRPAPLVGGDVCAGTFAAGTWHVGGGHGVSANALDRSAGRTPHLGSPTQRCRRIHAPGSAAPALPTGSTLELAAPGRRVLTVPRHVVSQATAPRDDDQPATRRLERGDAGADREIDRGFPSSGRPPPSRRRHRAAETRLRRADAIDFLLARRDPS